MRFYKYIVLGAGPSGLTLAHTLLDLGVPKDQVLVIEREKVAGGLCRSESVDGAPLDIGGGHFLDLKRPEVLDFVFRFLPKEEWSNYDRIAKINLHEQEIDHPLEANLWQLPKLEQATYLESIARAGEIGGRPKPTSFVDWVRWKFGDRIADVYMLPYNRKIWSMDLNQLGTYWLDKLPDVSFSDTLRSCLEGRPFGTLPAHGKFLYPKRFGYGEVWRRMGDALGECLVTETQVCSIDVANRTVNGCWQAGTIINTIPWTLWPGIAEIPASVKQAISELVHISIDVDYHPLNIQTSTHWIYEPNESHTYHRILVRHNFAPNSRGYWTETNSTRNTIAQNFRHHNEFAYPVNTREKPRAVAEVLTWAEKQKILGAGRWGRWEHMNSDVAVMQGLELAKTLVTAKS